MAASEVVAAAGLVVLNLALAALVAGVRPRRLANGVAAVLFAFNGLWSARQVFVAAGLSLGDAGQLDVALTAPTFAALLVFPFVFPLRRLSPRGERALLAAASSLVLALWALLALAPGLVLPNHPSSPLLFALGYAPFLLGLAAGTLLLLDTFLGSPSRIQRDQTRFILAAYALKLPSTALLLMEAVSEGRGGPALLGAPLLQWAQVPLGVALLAVPLGLAASRLRALRGKGLSRPWPEDAFVLFFLGLGFAASALGDIEYLLLRPLLFAYGILQYQLLQVDVREHRATLGAAVLAAMAVVFVVAARAFEEVGAGAVLATGAALAATVGAGGLLAWPLLRLLVAPGEESASRRLDLYRAALEEQVTAERERDSSGERVLRALRGRLRISEREHALLEAEARALLGGSGGIVEVGSPFLGRYVVERVLGEGGFARVFLARDEQVGRRVVLKVTRAPSPAEARRMLREARVIARIEHPSIVTVYDVEQVGEECVLVLEHVEGGSLAERLQRGALPLAEALTVADDVLAALEAAHAEGVVHRDVKPGNVLLTRRGRAKLADFGIARAPLGDTESGIALDGSQPGSLRYMSPEQVQGRDPDARSDLYSVGVVLYEMLAGEPYLDFTGLLDLEARVAILEREPKLPLPGVPEALNELLAEVLAKEPSQRPSNAAAMRRRLASGMLPGTK